MVYLDQQIYSEYLHVKLQKPDLYGAVASIYLVYNVYIFSHFNPIFMSMSYLLLAWTCPEQFLMIIKCRC